MIEQHLVPIKDINNDGLIDLVEGYSGHYKKLSDTLDTLSYLAELSDEDLYQNFADCIRHDHSRPFVNFSQENRDTYHRLKYRAINA
jgi:hypothetical protein